MNDKPDSRGVPSRLYPFTAGGGTVSVNDSVLRLERPASPGGAYVNAQIGDVGALGRKPPLRVRLRARFSQPSGDFHGTAGFGFWNAALAPGSGLPRPPRAAWFFLGGPEFDVPLVLDVPGNGFKAAILDAQRPAFFALLPTAPLGCLFMRHPVLYRRLWPLAQRALRAAEQPLGDLDITRWHRYDITWQRDRVRFGVDGRSVLDAPGPGWPLAFVAWIDNAVAVATPRGRFTLGTLATTRSASLEIADLSLENS